MKYVAMDQETGLLLAYGKTHLEALNKADDRIDQDPDLQHENVAICVYPLSRVIVRTSVLTQKTTVRLRKPKKKKPLPSFLAVPEKLLLSRIEYDPSGSFKIVSW